MFCKNCGTQIADSIKFCPSCGTPTGAGAQEPKQTAPHNFTAHTYPKINPIHTSNAKYKKKYNIGNFILWAGCLVAMISLFLAFVSVGAFGVSESVKLYDTDDGIYFIVIILAVAVINAFKLNIVSIAGSIVITFFLTMELSDMDNKLGSLGILSSAVDFGPGRTFLIFGAVLMVIGAVVAFILNRKAKKAAGF